jgi:hypothetical protein
LNLIRVMPAKGQDTMETSRSIARLVGPVFGVIGVGMLTSQAAYRDMAKEFVAGYPLIYFSGILLLVAGLAILNVHNVWTRDWRVCVTLLGWALAGIGTFRIIAPPFVAFLAIPVVVTTNFFIVTGFIFLGIGAFFSLKGYVA